ncbi:MAG: hypothetical protein DME26_03585 [Verrucomicrobia bacterium]|nr:MAG: hypothetical protein DME26_03585 [Verrucomicrobiota bacterium]
METVSHEHQHRKQSVTSTSIDGLHEVAVVVENSRSGKTIYELRTLLFDPPAYSTSSSSNERKDSGKKRERNKQ